jgi:hypothetical protein
MAASFKKMPASFSSFPPSSLPFCSTAALMSHPGSVFHTHHFAAIVLMFLISGLCPKAAVNCALLCYCKVGSSNFLPAFQDNLLVPSSEFLGFLNPENGTNSCPATSVRNHHYSLHNNTKRQFSFLFTVIVILLASHTMSKISDTWISSL